MSISIICTVPVRCVGVLRVILTNSLYSPINQFVFAMDMDCVLCKAVTLDCLVTEGLIFQSLAISLRTTRFNIQKFYMVLTLR